MQLQNTLHLQDVLENVHEQQKSKGLDTTLTFIFQILWTKERLQIC